MITRLFIENYRSIRKAELPLGKINVLTGANNSGKSSVLYAALTLKSLVSNPNRSLDAILTLPFVNLGGYKEIVHLKGEHGYIKTGVDIKSENSIVKYHSNFSLQSSPTLWLEGISPYSFEAWLNISFPYPLNRIETIDFQASPKGGERVQVDWNGILASGLHFENNGGIPTGEKDEIEQFINLPAKKINGINFIPSQRIFSKPFFGTVPLGQDITTEDEIATAIATDRDLEGLIAFYLEKIVDRVFNVRFTGGTSNFYLQTRDKTTGFTTDLVNEGSGINQLVTILAKTLKKGSDFICIDEPEIHLHPGYISKLAEVMVEIAENEGKQFLISTHSEHMVSALLNLLVSKKLAPEDLKVFYCSKPKKETQIELQAVNEKGQIEGGFKSFIDAELENTKTFFKIQ
jgi:putative AbiEii toxin of type IV toxin-antitoxin system